MVTTVARGIKLRKGNDGEISSITFDYKRYGAMHHNFLKPQGITISAEDIPNEATMEAIAELKAGKGKKFINLDDFLKDLYD